MVILRSDQRPGWGATSTNGVPAPDAPASLSGYEAVTPARRSPQVRRAQAIGSIRPDLLPKASSLEDDPGDGR